MFPSIYVFNLCKLQYLDITLDCSSLFSHNASTIQNPSNVAATLHRKNRSSYPAETKIDSKPVRGSAERVLSSLPPLRRIV